MTANTDVAERLRVTVAKELKQDVSTITREHTLRGDLKLNSLDAIELMFRIEEEFDLSIPDDDMQGFVKVGDVIDYLQRRLSGEPAAPAPPAAAAPAPPAAAAPAPPVFKTAAAAQRVTPAPKAAAAQSRATPAPKAAAKKAKPKAARRRA
jgi:acyl carrier protein